MTEKDLDYETTIQLMKCYFLAIKNKRKTIHIDKREYKVEERDVLRFTNGYDPDNGEIFAKLTKRITKKAKHVADEELIKAEVSRYWLYNYVDDINDEVTLYYFEVIFSRCPT